MPPDDGIQLPWAHIDEATGVHWVYEFSLRPEIQIDRLGSPGRDATSKEVTVFSPDGAFQKERRRYNRPVILISGDHPLATGSFIFFVKTAVHNLNQTRQMIEHPDSGPGFLCSRHLFY
jgi:hypothetical protein